MNRNNEPIAVAGFDRPVTVFFDMRAAARVQRELKFNPLPSGDELGLVFRDPEKFPILASICMAHEAAKPTPADVEAMITTQAQYEALLSAIARARAAFFGITEAEFNERIARAKEEADRKKTEEVEGQESPLAKSQA